jgi:hypothetical protein
MRRDVPRGLIYALVAVSGMLLGLLLLGLVFPEPPDLAQTAHPDSNSMLSSGSNAPGGIPILAAGFATGLLILLMFGLCLLVGIPPRARRLKTLILVGTSAYGLIFSGLMLSYLDFIQEVPTQIVGGFPTPTAWMIYGVWLFPWVFIIAYVYTFRTHYFTPEAEEHFRELLRRGNER